MAAGAHWSARYVGRPYVFGESDCAHLACAVRREVFGGEISALADSGRAASAFSRVAQMRDGLAEYAVPVSDPVEGDIVLMLCRGRPSHVGVFCAPGGHPHVLHALKSAGQAVLHRLRDLPRVQLAVEGFYRWTP
jgi:hypothetical protein